MKTFLYKKDQTALPVSISVSTVTGERNIVVGIVCVANDISKLIQLQDMTVQKNTLNTIIESLKDAVVAFDNKNAISICNSASLAMFARKKEEVKGKHIGHIVTLFDHNTPLNMMHLIHQAKHGNTLQVIQKNGLEAVDTDGKHSTVNVTITPIHDDAGLDLAGFVVLQDLSKEKQLEDMKLDFVSSAAHELRTPITSLRGYLSLLLDSSRAMMNEEQITLLQRADGSAERLSVLADNLLSVSNIERRNIREHLKPIDLLDTIKQVIANIRPQAENAHIRTELQDPETSLPPVPADSMLIRQVLTNLLSNAITYTPSGGAITIRCEQTDEYVVVHVEDTGEGIPKEALPHLFTKFFRVHEPLEQGTKGIGLGLYITKSIIDLHHGKIWAESALGKGSTFSFSLPKSSGI